MASSGYLQAAVLLLALQLLSLGAADADQETGTVIPAESRWICKLYPHFCMLDPQLVLKIFIISRQLTVKTPQGFFLVRILGQSYAD